jgi:hypothetical protein
MGYPIVIRPRPLLFRSRSNEWELPLAWQWFLPNEIEHGFADYLQRLDGWRNHYTKQDLDSWTVVDLHLAPHSDNDTLNDILETLQMAADIQWRWSWPNQLPHSLMLPIHLKHKRDAVIVKLRHG